MTWDQTLSLSLANASGVSSATVSVRWRLLRRRVRVNPAVLDAEQESRAKSESGGGEGVAADLALVAVDTGGEGGVVTGGVVTGGEGVGGIDEEGYDRGGAVVDGGDLQGSAAAASGCAQRQRVLADEELGNGGVAMALSSAMKGRSPVASSGGQQAPFPRVELGRRDHQLIEFQWRRVPTGAHDGSRAILVLEEELIDHVTGCKGLDMGGGHLPQPGHDELVQGAHCPTGAARVSVRSGGVCLSLV